MSTQLAYMAGLFDGEGSVDYTKRFHKRKNKPRAYWYQCITCEMAMTDKPVMVWFHENTQLGVLRLIIKSKQAGGKPHHKDQWRWRASHRDAYKFAKLIIPYARVKREKLQKIINHYDLKQTQKNDKLSLRYTDDRDVRVHHAVSGDGNNILKEPKTRLEQIERLTHDPIVD